MLLFLSLVVGGGLAGEEGEEPFSNSQAQPILFTTLKPAALGTSAPALSSPLPSPLPSASPLLPPSPPAPRKVLANQSTPTPLPSSTKPLPPSPPPSPLFLQGYQAENGHITWQGQALQLRGLNWFGFETVNHVPHGLWARNWQAMLDQIQSLGFNALRLPFCPASLHAAPVTSVNYQLNPDLAGKDSTQILDLLMQELAKRKMYVLLDQHQIDCAHPDALWYSDQYSEADWIQDLVQLAIRYQDNPQFLGLDLKNEPHGAAEWGSGNPKTDWKLAVEKAGKAILQANPNLLLFVQGVSQTAACSSPSAHFWGENLEPQRCAPLSLPRNKVVFSPHVYGPDVHDQSYFQAEDFPANLPPIWQQHFAYLVDQKFSLVPGEWGGRYGNGGDPRDKVWQDALVRFFLQKHICSSFYWSWNPNSADTQGVLQDDWQTPWENKIQLLQGYFTQCR